MTDQQRKNLASVADTVRANFPSVSESFAVGQIMLVTGRPWDKAIEGLKLMQAEKVLPDGWIKPETAGVLERMASRNPAIAKLFTRFDVVPGKTEIIEFCGFCRPKAVSPEALKKVFSLPEF
jgi:hypothetical protein